ncbi:MAG: hypothetical protein IJ597_01095, partial [Synergistaceae bacterium]|nr:hypothetical protein [Synergistaceae bacterium]
MSSPLEDAIKIRLKIEGQNLLEEDSDYKPLQEAIAIRNRIEANSQREQLAQERIANNHKQFSEPTKLFLTTANGLTQVLGDTPLSYAQAALARGEYATRPGNMKANLMSNLADMGMRQDIIDAEVGNKEIPEYDPEKNWIRAAVRQAAQKVTEARYNFDKFMNEANVAAVGNNPTKLEEGFHGAGTSLGFFAGAAPLMAAPGGNMAILGAGMGALRGVTEAITEATDVLTQNYMKDPTPENWEKGVKAMGYSLAANIPTDMFLDAIEDSITFGTQGRYVVRLLRGYLVNVPTEVVQEFKQSVIEDAANRTFESGDLSSKSFWDHLAKEVSENAGYHWNKVAASTAISTGITAPFFALMGGGQTATNNTNINKNSEIADELTFRTDENNEELEKLKADQATLQEQIKNSTNPEEQQKLLIRLDNINNAINNFGKDSETIKNEKLSENEGLENNSAPATVQDPKIQAQIQALEEERDRIQNTINQATVTPEYFADP